MAGGMGAGGVPTAPRADRLPRAGLILMTCVMASCRSLPSRDLSTPPLLYMGGRTNFSIK